MSRKKAYHYLYGPVPSRRFGRSLGIDLCPLKTCTENCIFCQVGPTPAATIVRREYVPTADVLAEIDHWLAAGGAADHLTLSGAGEPTLHSRFGDVLRHIGGATRIPSVLLTNSSLLHLPEVRADACAARIVKVSLSAWDQLSFERIHRPHADITFAKLLAGLRAFRDEFAGEIWMEVMVIDNVNSSPMQIALISELAHELRPQRVHLNTPVRPPAETRARPVATAELEQLAGLFTPRAEVIAEFKGEQGGEASVSLEILMAVVRRRPCTARQIAEVLHCDPATVSDSMRTLKESGLVREEPREGEVYYRSI